MTPPTTLGGTLVRHPDGWHWRDGTPEPRVRDLNRDATYNLRVTRDGAGQACVEVPRSLAENEPDLAWTLAWLAAGAATLGPSGDHTGPRVLGGTNMRRLALNAAGAVMTDRGIPPVIRVPLADWQAWTQTADPLGAEWDAADEPAILAEAARFGWRDPRP